MSNQRAAVLYLFINEEGSIDNIDVDVSFLPEDAQDILIKAFAKLKFNPGEIDGLPVKSQLMIEVDLEEKPEVHETL